MVINYTHYENKKLLTDWYPIKGSIKDIKQSVPEECFIQVEGKKFRIGREMP